MSQRHIIENAIIDLSFGSEAEALEQQASLGDLVRGRLMAVVERVLDEMSEPDRVFRIDQLDLDLGVVPYQGYQEELAIRLEERLREQLREKLAALAHHAVSGDVVITRARSRQEQLEHYLRHGRLPWHAGSAPDRSIDQLLEEAVRFNLPDLVTLLRHSSGSPGVLARVTRQFPDRLLGRIVRSVAPSLAETLASLIPDFQKLWRHRPFVTGSARELRSLIWELALQQLLPPGQSPPDHSAFAFIEGIVAGLSASTGGDPVQLRESLTEASRQLPPVDRLGPELTRYLQAPAGAQTRSTRAFSFESPEAPGGAALTSAPERGDRRAGCRAFDSRSAGDLSGLPQVWQQRLTAALRNANPQLVRPIWSRLLLDYPQAVRESFLQHARPARVRRELVRRFPEAMLQELVELFLPEAGGFIRELLTREEQLLTALGNPAAIDGAVLRSEVWESALSGLLVTVATELDRASFIAALLDRLEARIAPAEPGTGPTTPAPTPPAQAQAEASRDAGELQQLLRDLTGRPDAAAVLVRQQDYQAASHTLARAYEVQHRLRQAMARTTPGSEVTDPAIPLIDELTQHYPWQLLRLFRELQAAPGTALQLTSGLSTAALEHLVQSVLALPQPGNGAGPSDLMQAVSSYAERVEHPHRYYQQVLTQLLEDRPIDLAAIIAEAPPAGPTEAPDTTSPGTGGVIDEPASDRTTPVERPVLPSGAGAPCGSYDAAARLPTPGAMPADISGDTPGRPFAPDVSGSATPLGSDSESRSLVHSHELYYRLRWALLGELLPPPGTEASLVPVIDELLAHYPWQLARLLREWREGDATTPAGLALSVAELERLVRALLSLPRADTGAEPSVLLDAIGAYAGATPNRHPYYQQILDCLLQDRVIDFEAITHAVPATPEAGRDTPGTPAAAGTPAADLPGAAAYPTTRPDLEALTTGLTGYLQGGQPISTEFAARLTLTVELLLARQPVRLRRLLEPLLERPPVVERVIDLLPERLLTRLLWLLRPVDHYRAQRSADILADALADAAQVHGLGVSPSRAARLKWRFLFRYLVEEGLPFALEPFTTRFADYLAEAIAAPELSGGTTPPDRQTVAAPPAPLAPLANALDRSQESPDSAAAISGGNPPGPRPESAGASPETPEIDLRTAPAGLPEAAGPGALPGDAEPSSEAPGGMTPTAAAGTEQALPQTPETPGIESPAEAVELVEDPSQTTAQDTSAADALPPREDAVTGEPPSAVPGAAATSDLAEAPEGAPEPELQRAWEPPAATPGAATPGEAAAIGEARPDDTVREAAGPSDAVPPLASQNRQEPAAAGSATSHLPEAPVTGDVTPAASAIDTPRETSGTTTAAQQLAPQDAAAPRPATPGSDSPDPADRREFRARLSQQIARNMLPSTQEQHQSIIRALHQDAALSHRPGNRPGNQPGNQPGNRPGPEAVTHDFPERGGAAVRPSPFNLTDRLTHRHRPTNPPADPEPATEDPEEDIYIANAGLVLASPYLPRLFGLLDLTAGPAFRDPGAAERGVHLLQYLVNESAASPEYELTLNKLLCGVPLGRPIERGIDITDREKEVVEGLIQGMIQNWGTIGNTSVAGFRESFLQREGRLQLRGDAWHLLVEQRAFDLLLDSLPWSFGTIRHPWMERVIFVEWR